MTVVGTLAPARAARGRALLWAAFVAGAALLGGAGGVLAHLATSGGPVPLRLPELHGQVSWDPGARPAPSLAVRDAAGAVVPLASLRGHTVVLAVEPDRCGAACASLRGAVATIVRALPPAQRPLVVSVAGSVAARRLGRSPHVPLVYLLDRSGDLRTGYLFPFAPAFVQDDLQALALEGR